MKLLSRLWARIKSLFTIKKKPVNQQNTLAEKLNDLEQELDSKTPSIRAVCAMTDDINSELKKEENRVLTVRNTERIAHINSKIVELNKILEKRPSAQNTTPSSVPEINGKEKTKAEMKSTETQATTQMHDAEVQTPDVIVIPHFNSDEERDAYYKAQNQENEEARKKLDEKLDNVLKPRMNELLEKEAAANQVAEILAKATHELRLFTQETPAQKIQDPIEVMVPLKSLVKTLDNCTAMLKLNK